MADTTLRDAPIPTLPTKLDIPVTLRELNAEADVTERDPPTPTLPVVFKVVP